MAMKYGWFGNLTDPSRSDITNKIANTSMTHYMPYGLRGRTSFSSYETGADDAIRQVGGTDVKVLLEIPSAAVGNSSFVTSMVHTPKSKDSTWKSRTNMDTARWMSRSSKVA